MKKKEKKQNIIKIISMPVDKGGCGQYRIRQPLAMIQANTPHDTHIVDKDKDDMLQVYEALKVADIIIIRQGGEGGMRMLKEKYPEIKAKWVLDIDDNIELISPYSEHYREYGTKEFFDKNSQIWLWKDQERGFNRHANYQRVKSLVQSYQEVDLVTVTTEKLAEYAKESGANHVKVLPNCINLLHWWKPNFKKKKRLRVGWSGGVSHYEDFYEIRKPFNRLMDEYDFDLYLIGADFRGLFDKKHRKRIQYHQWVEFTGHSYRMMMMDLDIAVVPLASLPFNEYKSSIKYLEFSAMGCPSVVKNMLPYSEDITKGRAMPYKTTKQFYKGMKNLIEQPALRNKIGFAARKYVESNYDAAKCATMWIDAYKSIWK
jgi:glycosyltransferase involved in cell wall biosynthesis